MVEFDDSATSATNSSFSVHNALKLDDSVPPMPRRQGRMKRRHSVDFKPPADTVNEFEKMDEEAKTLCWYSKDEYDIIKARNSLIVKMMKTGHFRESDEHSFRGLEHKLKEGFKQRRANKFNALNAVLEEQDRQMSEGVTEPEKIAKKYRRVSLNAAETAFVVGMRDAEESMAYNPDAPRPQQPAVVPFEDGEFSDISPVQYDESDTIESEIVDEESAEQMRREVSGLFAAASEAKHSCGRMSRRSSM